MIDALNNWILEAVGTFLQLQVITVMFCVRYLFLQSFTGLFAIRISFKRNYKSADSCFCIVEES